MIYNYFEDVGYVALTIFLVLAILLFGIALGYTIKFVKLYITTTSRANIIELFVQLLVLLVLFVLFVFFSYNAMKLGKVYHCYNTKGYKVVEGVLYDVNGSRNDYRSEEQYDVSFYVNGVKFENTNISCSKDLLVKLSDAEGRNVVIYYTGEKEYFIYVVALGETEGLTNYRDGLREPQ